MNLLIAEEIGYVCGEQARLLELRLQQLNEGQRYAYNCIIEGIDNKSCLSFFVTGPGGTGKTFLYKTLACHYRAKGKVKEFFALPPLALRRSFCQGSATAHSRFRIPLKAGEGSTCQISNQSDTAELLRQVKLIIWDEAPVQNKHDNAADSVEENSQDLFLAIQAYAEYLSTLEPASLPPSRLRLKVGVPVILIRYIRPATVRGWRWFSF